MGEEQGEQMRTTDSLTREEASKGQGVGTNAIREYSDDDFSDVERLKGRAST